MLCWDVFHISGGEAHRLLIAVSGAALFGIPGQEVVSSVVS